MRECLRMIKEMVNKNLERDFNIGIIDDEDYWIKFIKRDIERMEKEIELNKQLNK